MRVARDVLTQLEVEVATVEPLRRALSLRGLVAPEFVAEYADLLAG